DAPGGVVRHFVPPLEDPRLPPFVVLEPGCVLLVAGIEQLLGQSGLGEAHRWCEEQENEEDCREKLAVHVPGRKQCLKAPRLSSSFRPGAGNGGQTAGVSPAEADGADSWSRRAQSRCEGTRRP